ncbi:TlpA disulfide reductase family protein [Amycolatopsis sp. NPDC051102]|uniref:TlpA family protein disulfide reductase n=1 Tax=Amycolatopsis sp. NPDC051102 TaxID=3155163 RepID=UPI003423B40F
MSSLITADIVLGALGVLNLVLLLGVVRRLREHAKAIEAASKGGGTAPEVMIAPGASPDAFTTSTTDGAVLSGDLLPGSALIGFFTPHCGACTEQLPRFLERAEAEPGGRSAVLAVVIGLDTDDDTRAMARQFEAAARTVIEPPGGPVASAFGVRGFPAVCVLDDDGRIASRGFVLEELAAPVAGGRG